MAVDERQLMELIVVNNYWSCYSSSNKCKVKLVIYKLHLSIVGELYVRDNPRYDIVEFG